MKLFILFALFFNYIFATNIENIEKEIQHIQTLSPDKRFIAMNKLKLAIRKLNETERKEIIMNIQKTHNIIARSSVSKISNISKIDVNDIKDSVIKDTKIIINKPETTQTPEIEQPETTQTPNVEKPEVTQTPETPEIEQPETTQTPDVEKPEVTQTPEIEQPETTQTPDIEKPNNNKTDIDKAITLEIASL